MVEHFLGKEEVIGSNPIVSTICRADRPCVRAPNGPGPGLTTGRDVAIEE